MEVVREDRGAVCGPLPAKATFCSSSALGWEMLRREGGEVEVLVGEVVGGDFVGGLW